MIKPEPSPLLLWPLRLQPFPHGPEVFLSKLGEKKKMHVSKCGQNEKLSKGQGDILIAPWWLAAM